MSNQTRLAFVRITDEEGALLASFQVSDTTLAPEEIAAYLEAEASERFDVETL